MIRNDGLYTIYRIQHQEKKPKKWVFSSLDSFGAPPGFDACGDCWQETGEHGVFTIKEARKGLNWIRKENKKERPEIQFRLVQVIISQKTIVV